MASLGPHISVSDEQVLSRVFGIIDMDRFAEWPEGVRKLAASLAAELFLVRYNPFIDASLVRKSVERRLNISRPLMSGEYPKILSAGIREFWAAYDADQRFREDLVSRLQGFLEDEMIGDEPNLLIESSTDATDLRMELPMLVLFPETEEQVQQIVRLANEMRFSIIPRGGGTGLTGGAIPMQGRTVIMSMSRFKKILDIDTDNMSITAQAGVITLDAIKAAAEQDLLFTVDPASKAGSSLGGNISENSGGPFAFEYGTTIDNILSFRMVTSLGEMIEVSRKDHPRHKIFEDEAAIFEIRDASGNLQDTVQLGGDEIRGEGLGKDVSNKYLGGLPGVQKEGVDGIITSCSFICHPTLSHSRTLCLEFFGRSMRNAMLVIKDVVGLRDTIREQGDLVKISALEEFGPKYVQAIEYAKKSDQHEGDPISVLLIQLDSDHEDALEQASDTIVTIAQQYEGVAIFPAKDEKQAEFYWEDRHKLSAIAKRTSGFKINEDVVIPMEVIPDFSDFLEDLNLIYLAKIYRKTLIEVREMDGVSIEDADIEEGIERARAIIRGDINSQEISDQEQEAQCRFLFHKLRNTYPRLDREIKAKWESLQARRIVIANHMHAGDGNCHVNLPVNSNDAEMLASAHEAADVVMTKVKELGGEVSGEHGIGITKIAFQNEEKIAALAEYKKRVDPQDVLNPGKLTRRKLPTSPFTFSFNRLILDLDKTALKDKEELMQLLRNVQTCTRCGKCKQVCPMYHPARGIMFHPRNKNISLGALIEAIHYSQIQTGEPSQKLLALLRKIVEHCTACGKCTAVCPVKIDSAGAALSMRAFLDYKGQSGHPIKKMVLNRLAKDTSLVPITAKALSVGQALQNRVVDVMPKAWRGRVQSPLFRSRGPAVDFRNLYEVIDIDKGAVLKNPIAKADDTVFYFPGCGGGLFSREIGQATIYLLLKAGMNVVLPKNHMCCGYPLLASGCEEAYKTNRHRNNKAFLDVLVMTGKAGLKATALVTACGTCRESLATYDYSQELVEPLRHLDAVQLLMERMPTMHCGGDVLYHSSCHAEWVDAPKAKAPEMYRKAFAELTGSRVRLSPNCCGESGLGALTNPEIYNTLRERKQDRLQSDLGMDKNQPVVVGCPSCKVGIRRSMIQMKRSNPVMHATEYMAQCLGGPKWKKELKQLLERVERKG